MISITVEISYSNLNRAESWINNIWFNSIHSLETQAQQYD